MFFTKPAGLALALPLVLAQVAQDPVDEPVDKPPNIVVILIDDLGYNDLHFHGNEKARTPRMDSLLREGIRFTNGYVSQPSCEPSRAGLLTGRSPCRYGFVNPTSAPQKAEDEARGVPTSEISLPHVLGEAGYATGVIGKWHLGMNPQFHPLVRGFDEFFGHLGGGHEYFEWDTPLGGPIYRNQEPAEGDTYLTEAFADEAVAFLERHKEHPFFLFLSFNAVHSPFEAPQRYLEQFEAEPDAKPWRRPLLAMLASLDDSVGRVLDKLESTGLEQNTLLFFLSDNGAMAPSRNAPFREGKFRLHEGGIRVPFTLRWPHRLDGAREYHEMVTIEDIFTTAVQAAGATIPADREIDGVDLVPFLARETTGAPHDVLYWNYRGHHAVREGDWKLVFRGGWSKPAAIELFQITLDPYESNNVFEANEERATRMRRNWIGWMKSMPKALF